MKITCYILLLLLIGCSNLSLSRKQMFPNRPKLFVVPFDGGGEIGWHTKKGLDVICDTKKPTFYGEFDSARNEYVVQHYDSFLSQASLGVSGEIAGYDSKCKQLFSIIDPYIHHDFAIHPDGSIFYLKFVPYLIEGGKQLFTDHVYKYDRLTGKSELVLKVESLFTKGEINKFIKNNKHYFNGSKYGDFIHTNSINFSKVNADHIVLTMRHISKVVVYSVKTSKKVWESRDGLFEYPHDASIISENQLALFNNGNFSLKKMSDVFIVNMKSQDIEFKLSDTFLGPYKTLKKMNIFTPFMGSVQFWGNQIIVGASLKNRVTSYSHKGEELWSVQGVTQSIKARDRTPTDGFFKIRAHH